MSKTCPFAGVPCDSDVCEVGGLDYCDQQERDAQFQAGYKLGMEVMQNYIADWVKAVRPGRNVYWAELVRTLPPPTDLPEGGDIPPCDPADLVTPSQ